MEREGRYWRAWNTAAALHGRENIRPIPHPRLDHWVSQYYSWDLLGERTRQGVFETVPHGKQLYSRKEFATIQRVYLGLINACLPDPSLHVIEFTISYSVLGRRRWRKIWMKLMLGVFLRFDWYRRSIDIRGRWGRGRRHASRGCDRRREYEVIDVHGIGVRGI